MRRFSANASYSDAKSGEAYDEEDDPVRPLSSHRMIRECARQRRLVAQVLLGFLISVWLILQSHSIPLVRSILTGDVVISGYPRSTASHPKISLVVVWTGDDLPNYLGWFFDSIARQPQELELVIVQRGDRHLDLTPAITQGATNIKIVQMSNDRCRSRGHSIDVSICELTDGARGVIGRLGSAPGVPLQEMGRMQ